MKPVKVWRVSELMPDGTWNEWDIDYDTRRQAKLAIRAMGKDKTKVVIRAFLRYSSNACTHHTTGTLDYAKINETT